MRQIILFNDGAMPVHAFPDAWRVWDDNLNSLQSKTYSMWYRHDEDGIVLGIPIIKDWITKAFQVDKRRNILKRFNIWKKEGKIFAGCVQGQYEPAYYYKSGHNWFPKGSNVIWKTCLIKNYGRYAEWTPGYGPLPL